MIFLAIGGLSQGTVIIPYNEIVFNLVFDIVDRDHDGALDREEMFFLVIKFIEMLDKAAEKKNGGALMQLDYDY